MELQGIAFGVCVGWYIYCVYRDDMRAHALCNVDCPLQGCFRKRGPVNADNNLLNRGASSHKYLSPCAPQHTCHAALGNGPNGPLASLLVDHKTADRTERTTK